MSAATQRCYAGFGVGVLTNVFRRGGVFYFRTRVPVQLRSRVGRSELWRSLRTSDPLEARRRGSVVLSLTVALWRDLERAMDVSEIQALIDGWTKGQLEADASFRVVTTTRPELESHYETLLTAFGGALYNDLENDQRDAKRYVDELVRELGLNLEEGEYQIAVRLMMRAHKELFRALVQRHHKLWRPWLDDDPAAGLVQRVSHAALVGSPQPNAVATTHGRLSQVAEDAIADLGRRHRWKPKRMADYKNAVATLILALGQDPDMGEVTKDVAGRFMRDLERYPSNVTKRLPYRELQTFKERVEAVVVSGDDAVLDAVTINGKYLTPLRRIYDWRKVERNDLTNPFEGLRAEVPKRTDPKEDRRDFTLEEVRRWFAQPMFTGAAGTRGRKLYQAGGLKIDDHRVWVPLICFFTGMRLNEACGLAVRDLRTGEGIDFFHVRDEVEGQSVKSEAARRKVPVHPALVEAGLLRFVERQRLQGRTRLFEELKLDANGYFSSAASQWFNRLIDQIEEKTPEEPGKLVFHSIRHTVVTRLRLGGVANDVRKEIVGHEQGEVHGGYGSFPLALLKESVDQISYPGVDLTAVARP